MDKDSPIVIERVANGYQIRPMFGQGEAVCVRDVMVFQDMGYASGDGVRPTESTLLGFVAQHFTEPKTPNVELTGAVGE